MTDTPRTDTDRDALAERFVYHCVDCMGDLGFASTDEWLDALIAEVRRQALAPILALADEWDDLGSYTRDYADELRAAVDAADPTAHDRAVAVAPVDLLVAHQPLRMIEEGGEVMHDAYEKAAGESGWLTQERSRVPWADVPEANKATMRLAVRALVPLIEADVGERIAAAMVETPADRVTWDDGTEFISSADAQRIARAVATGDEGAIDV